MIRKALLAVAVLVLSALPSFAADATATGTDCPKGEMGAPGMRAMRQQMMRNPQHLLMMAYHKNVMAFGMVLEKAARMGDTVPPDVARTAIAEMRRSVTEMEKYRASVLAGLPSSEQNAEMKKMMDEHLVNVKTNLNELENLAKSDRIPSREVLEHVQAIFHGCQGACELLPGRGMHGGPMGMRGMRHDCWDGCGHQCNGMHRHNCGYDCGCQMGGDGQMMTSGHRQMMQEMTEKLKAQDQELVKRVEKMKRAPRDKKLDELADIVATMVQQRAAMTTQMEKMQKQSQMFPPPPPTMKGGNEVYQDSDGDSDGDGEMDMSDMDMNDM